MFEIMTRSSPASLIVASHGIPQAMEDSLTADPQHHLPSAVKFAGQFSVVIKNISCSITFKIDCFLS